ncbi:MAG: carbon-nitrogen hydrolase family protein [Acidobacteria bacterium]|nr:carbon-nitrogen hydrolase family protein [Acidobacteriota bacterium]
MRILASLLVFLCFLAVAQVTLVQSSSQNWYADSHPAGMECQPGRQQTDQTTITIAQVRAVPEKGRLEANHRLLMRILGEVEKHPGVDVTITPEGFLDGYVATEKEVTPEDMVRYAVDPATSPYVRAATDWARRNRCWLVYGCARLEGERVFNSALIITREGRIAWTYDKLHIQTHDFKYAPGRHLSVYPSEFGPFGVMICADRRWPETVRTMALAGARVIFNPTYGMDDEFNVCMMRTRSFESELYIAFTHPRQSLITDPGGRVLLDDRDGKRCYSVTTIDLAQADARRASPSGHLRDRRTDIYR